MRWADAGAAALVVGSLGCGAATGDGEAAAVTPATRSQAVAPLPSPPPSLVRADPSAPVEVARAEPPRDLPPHAAPLFEAGRTFRYDVRDDVDTHDPEAGGRTETHQRIECVIEVVGERAELWFAELSCVPLDEEVVLLPEVLHVAFGAAGLWVELGSAPTPDERAAELRDTPPLFARVPSASKEDPSAPCRQGEERRGPARCAWRTCRDASPYGEQVQEVCLDAEGIASLRLENVHGPRELTWRRLAADGPPR